MRLIQLLFEKIGVGILGDKIGVGMYFEFFDDSEYMLGCDEFFKYFKVVLVGHIKLEVFET